MHLVSRFSLSAVSAQPSVCPERSATKVRKPKSSRPFHRWNEPVSEFSIRVSSTLLTSFKVGFSFGVNEEMVTSRSTFASQCANV